MLGFLIFALAFVILLTLVVRLARLRVRGELDYSRAVGLTVLVRGGGPGGVVVSDARPDRGSASCSR